MWLCCLVVRQIILPIVAQSYKKTIIQTKKLTQNTRFFILVLFYYAQYVSYVVTFALNLCKQKIKKSVRLLV